MSATKSVGQLEQFPEGQVKIHRIQGQRVAVVQFEGQFYAFEDRCTHDDGPLGEGRLHGCEIECPRHGARFDVRDGRVTRSPALYPLEIYDVEVRDGEVYVTLPG